MEKNLLEFNNSKRKKSLKEFLEELVFWDISIILEEFLEKSKENLMVKISPIFLVEVLWKYLKKYMQYELM